MAAEEDIKQEAVFFDNVKSHKLFCRYWKPDQGDVKPRALVFICHGFSEHSGRHNIVAAPLVAQNLFVFSHDHVGHGQSEGARVDIVDFNDYIADVITHIHSVKKTYPDCPVFIIGYSMGGLLAASVTLEEPDLISGAVLIAPALTVDANVFRPWKVTAVTWLSKLLPQVHIARPIEPNLFCRDPKVVDEYQKDPLVYHDGVKARWVVQYYGGVLAFRKRMSEFKCPVFILYGDADQVCELSGAQDLQEKAASTDKTLKIYPGGYHSLHREPEGQGEEVIQDIVNWITARI